MSHCSLLLSITLISVLSTTVVADDMGEMTPEREAAAMTFAMRHHPELHELLASLKAMRQPGYETAIAELFQTSERLTKLKSRTPDRYETDLELWKIDSRVRLLAAHSAGSMDSETRAQMKQLIEQRYRIRIAQLHIDRAKMVARIEKLDETIDGLESQLDANAERDIERLLKSAKSRSTKSARAKSAVNVPAESTPATQSKSNSD